MDTAGERIITCPFDLVPALHTAMNENTGLRGESNDPYDLPPDDLTRQSYEELSKGQYYYQLACVPCGAVVDVDFGNRGEGYKITKIDGEPACLAGKACLSGIDPTR